VGAGAGEDQRADDRFTFVAEVPRIAVQFGGGVEERLDLLGGVQVGRRLSPGLQQPLLAARRVPGEPFVLDGEAEEPGEALDRLVDRGRIATLAREPAKSSNRAQSGLIAALFATSSGR
jgi:hypothetical protein